MSDHKYLAFIDVLGASEKWLEDFDKTKQEYLDVIDDVFYLVPAETRNRVAISVVSDSFIVESEELLGVIVVGQLMHMQAMQRHNWMLRGGLSFGRHQEIRDDKGMQVMSEALVRAVAIEKNTRMPRVEIDSRITIPERERWEKEHPFLRPYIDYDGRLQINPFNVAWGSSFAFRVKCLKEDYPAYSDKYDWFLDLHQYMKQQAIKFNENQA